MGKIKIYLIEFNREIFFAAGMGQVYRKAQDHDISGSP